MLYFGAPDRVDWFDSRGFFRRPLLFGMPTQ